MDLYAALSRYYDIENAGLVEDLALYAGLASEAPPGPVLDLGCGSGRVTLALAESGRDVIGVDSSAAMLARARARLARRPGLAGRVTLLEADVARFAPGPPAALAIWAYNGFMHLLEPAHQRAALARVAESLQPGARLVVDLPNPSEPYAAEHSGALTVERRFHDPEGGAEVLQQASTRLDRAAQRLSVTWIYDAVYADGRVERLVAPLTLRYTFPAELDLLLELSGLRRVAFYGDYDASPFDDAGPRLIAVAERPA